MFTVNLIDGNGVINSVSTVLLDFDVVTTDLTFSGLSALVHNDGELDDITFLETRSVSLFGQIEIDDTGRVTNLTLEEVLLLGFNIFTTILGLLDLSFNVEGEDLTSEGLVVVPLFEVRNGNGFSSLQGTVFLGFSFSLLSVIVVVIVVFLSSSLTGGSFLLFVSFLDLEDFSEVLLFGFVIVSLVTEIVVGRLDGLVSNFGNVRSEVESSDQSVVFLEVENDIAEEVNLIGGQSSQKFRGDVLLVDANFNIDSSSTVS